MQVINRRTRGNEPPFEPIIHDKNLSRSLKHFLIYELGYGGQITDLKEDEVTVRTFVMSCMDDTTFKWNEKKRPCSNARCDLDICRGEKGIQERIRSECSGRSGHVCDRR